MKIGWIITVGISVLIVALLYFYQFHGELSSSAGDWANFGDYLNGVLAPILTIVNIWVFVKLTQTIRMGEQRQKEAELSYQKKLLLMQLRQKELDQFSKVLNDALVLKAEDIMANNTYPIVYAAQHTTSFLATKSDLFPIIRDEKLSDEIVSLHQLISEYNREYFSGDLRNPKDVTPIIRKLLNSSNSVIGQLQSFVLNDLN